MPKMRTLPKAIEHIKAKDPDTALTPHALRLLVLSGEIPHVKIGAKRLVDVGLLEKYLCGEYPPVKAVPPQSQNGQIRRLS